MNCRKAEKQLLRSIDGRLDERARGLLAKHLEACPACRKAEKEYRSMLSLLKDSPGAAPLPRFWERLEPRLREETELVPLLFWERWSLRAIPVFLALVILIGGFLLFTPSGARDGPVGDPAPREQGSPVGNSDPLRSGQAGDENHDAHVRVPG